MKTRPQQNSQEKDNALEGVVKVTFNDPDLRTAKKQLNQMLDQQPTPGDDADTERKKQTLRRLSRRQLDLERIISGHYKEFFYKTSYGNSAITVIDAPTHDAELFFEDAIMANEYAQSARKAFPQYTFEVR